MPKIKLTMMKISFWHFYSYVLSFIFVIVIRPTETVLRNFLSLIECWLSKQTHLLNFQIVLHCIVYFTILIIKNVKNYFTSKWCVGASKQYIWGCPGTEDILVSLCKLCYVISIRASADNNRNKKWISYLKRVVFRI